MTDYRIWPATNGPNTSGEDGQPINVGTKFRVTSQAWATGIRFYRGTANVSPDNLRLYLETSSTTGTVLAELVSPSYSGTGWVELAFSSPVELTPGEWYKVVAHMPDHYTATGGYWAPGGPGDGGITQGLLVAPDTAVEAQSTYKYGVPSYPDGTFNGGNYWVDVVLTDVDPAAGTTVTLDLAVETDSAHAGTPAHTVPLALATEVDSSHALAVVKTVPLALAVEQDTALPVSAAHIVPLGLASEVDTAHAGSIARSVTLGLAIETDTAFPVTIPGVLLRPGTHTASSSTSRLNASSTVAGLEAR